MHCASLMRCCQECLSLIRIARNVCCFVGCCVLSSCEQCIVDVLRVLAICTFVYVVSPGLVVVIFFIDQSEWWYVWWFRRTIKILYFVCANVNTSCWSHIYNSTEWASTCSSLRLQMVQHLIPCFAICRDSADYKFTGSQDFYSKCDCSISFSLNRRYIAKQTAYFKMAYETRHFKGILTNPWQNNVIVTSKWMNLNLFITASTDGLTPNNHVWPFPGIVLTTKFSHQFFSSVISIFHFLLIGDRQETQILKFNSPPHT